MSEKQDMREKKQAQYLCGGEKCRIKTIFLKISEII